MLTCPHCTSAVAPPDDPRALSTSCRKCGTKIDLFDVRTIAPSATPATAPVEEVLPPGKVLAGYRIERLLGRGGMAVVYQATQLSLGRPVAVKTLPRQLAASEAFIARFNRESAALAALAHPNIIHIIDRGVHDGLYFFAMEYVEGDDLHARMKRQRPSVAESFRIVGQILAALEFAHRRGVIHRDVKPGNVLLDAHGNAKVTDFGIAHLTGQAGDTNLGLTMSGSQMGTVNYMAPEQRTDARAVDQRADLYAAGVVLYELLTGRLPLGAFEPPSGLVPGLDPRIDAVVLRAMRQDPASRYASAAEMAAALASVAGSAPSPASSAPAVAGPVEPSAPSTAPCPFCKAENRADARFCLSCGKTVVETCPKCKKTFRAGGRFCDACGTNVGEYLTQLKGDLEGRLKSIEKLVKAGRHGEALGDLDAVLAAEGADLDELKTKARDKRTKVLALKEKIDSAFQEGQTLYDRRDFEGAIERWTKLPPADYVGEAIGEARRKVESREKAVREAEAADRAGKPMEALEAWKRAAALATDPPPFASQMQASGEAVTKIQYDEGHKKGAAAVARKDFDAAIAAFSEVLRWSPQDPIAHHELENARAGKLAAERARLVDLGDQARAAGRPNDALGHWRSALALAGAAGDPMRVELQRKIEDARAASSAGRKKLWILGSAAGAVALVVLLVVIAVTSGDDDAKGGSSGSSTSSTAGGTPGGTVPGAGGTVPGKAAGGDGGEAKVWPGSPEELYSAGIGLILKGDLDTLWELQSSNIHAAMTRAEFYRTIQSMYQPWNPMGVQVGYMTQGRTSRSGDRATVYWTYPTYDMFGNPNQAEYYFNMVREPGGWRYDQ